MKNSCSHLSKYNTTSVITVEWFLMVTVMSTKPSDTTENSSSQQVSVNLCLFFTAQRENRLKGISTYSPVSYLLKNFFKSLQSSVW